MPGGAVESLRKSINRLVKAYETVSAINPNVALFPAPLWSGSAGGEPQEIDVLAWLEGGGPPVAVLSGRLGAGKTVATCMLYRELQSKRRANDIDVWVPLGRIYTITDPIANIAETLRIPRSRLRLDEIRCLILDGVDEFVCRCSDVELKKWFLALLNELSQAKPPPRLVLSGRDVAVGRQNLLFEWLQSYCRTVSMQRHRTPLRLELSLWNPARYRKQLRLHLTDALKAAQQGLSDAEVKEEVKRRLSLVPKRVLDCPLFYRLAYDFLKEGHLPDRPLASQRQLMNHWIETILGREQQGHQSTIKPESRRRALRELARFLVLSGRGTSGATLDELANEQGLDPIWRTLKSEPDPLAGFRASNHDFEQCFKELTYCTLLRCNNERFAPFHEQVLIHLAAEAFDEVNRQLYGASDPGDSPPSPPATPPPGLLHNQEKLVIAVGGERDAGIAIRDPGVNHIATAGLFDGQREDRGGRWRWEGQRSAK
jgi:hypothetical protein